MLFNNSKTKWDFFLKKTRILLCSRLLWDLGIKIAHIRDGFSLCYDACGLRWEDSYSWGWLKWMWMESQSLSWKCLTESISYNPYTWPLHVAWTLMQSNGVKRVSLFTLVCSASWATVPKNRVEVSWSPFMVQPQWYCIGWSGRKFSQTQGEGTQTLTSKLNGNTVKEIWSNILKVSHIYQF